MSGVIGQILLLYSESRNAISGRQGLSQDIEGLFWRYTIFWYSPSFRG